MIHEIGLPIPVYEGQSPPPTAATRLADWQSLYDPNLQQAQYDFVPPPAKAGDPTVLESWLALGERVLLEQASTAFGVRHGAPPTMEATSAAFPRTVTLNPRRASQADLDELLDAITYKGKPPPPGSPPPPFGSAIWGPKGKDRGLVCLLSRSRAYGGGELPEYFTASIGSDVMLPSSQDGPRWRVDQKPAPSAPFLLAAATARVVAHECGHSLGLGDEYGGNGAAPAPLTPDVLARVEAYGNLLHATTVTTPGGHIDVTPPAGPWPRWAGWPRITKAGLTYPLSQTSPGDTDILMADGHTAQFTAGDTVMLRTRDLLDTTGSGPTAPRYSAAMTVRDVDPVGEAVTLTAAVPGAPSDVFPGGSVLIGVVLDANGQPLPLLSQVVRDHLEQTDHPVNRRPGTACTVPILDGKADEFGILWAVNLPAALLSPTSPYAPVERIVGLYDGGIDLQLRRLPPDRGVPDARRRVPDGDRWLLRLHVLPCLPLPARGPGRPTGPRRHRRPLREEALPAMTAPTGPFEQLAAHIAAALAPLGESVSSVERFRGLMLRLGWDVTSLPQPYVDLGRDARALAAQARGFIDEPTPGLALELLEGAGEAYRAMSALPAPDGADQAQFTAEIGERLFELLLGDHLQAELPVVLALLEILGLAELELHPADGDRPAYGRLRLAWHELPAVLADAGGRILDRYRWGDAAFEPRAVLEEVLSLCAGAGILVGLGSPTPSVASGYAAGEATGSPPLGHALQVMVASAPAGDGRAPVGFDLLALPGSPGELPGLLLQPNLPPGLGSGFRLGEGWEVLVDGATDPASPLGLVVRPGALSLRTAFAAGGGLPPGGISATLQSTGTAPAVLLGSPTASRMEVGSTSVALTLTDDGGRPELAATVQLEDVALVISLSDLGAFLAALIGGGELRAAFGVEFTWTTGEGLSIGGEAGLELTMTPDLTLGPITIDVIELAVRGSTSPTPTVTAEALVGVTGSLPPISFTVDPCGIALQIDFVNGNAGPADIATVFLPPTGLGLSVEAPLTSGGGRIAAYPETGRYEGALAIDIASVGIQAMTVIDTAVAGEPDGWTFFASLTARFPGIPLGFGFTLMGAGGLVALNRAVDGEALALGLRDGAADALLFPDNPARDSAILFGQLDEYFPASPGNTVIGPVIEVGWGTATIVTGQLGVLISLPQGVLTILGSLSADLPTPDAPVLELRMDSLGVIDVPGGTVLVVASLYDSRLLGVIELSGDAGLYLSVIEDPYFVLSVGGYHPGFQPPSHVPAVLESLRQMRAEVEVAEGVSAAITAYFAVTSNSVQFGGGFELEASAEFLSVTYLARGWFEFDVLLQFTPFLLIAEVSAGVGVYAGDKELLGVELFAHLEGPEPWFATARGRFRFFVVNVRFEVTVGGHAAPERPPSADVLALMGDELAHPEAWSARHPSAPPAGLVLRTDLDDAVIRPDDSVVVVQSVAPLGETLARFGELTPVQDEVDVAGTAVVDGATGEALSGVEVEDVLGWFAPAQFQSMRDEARLAAPSYEQHRAGVAFGAGGVAVPDDEAVAAPEGHETEVWQPATGAVHALGVLAIDRPLDVLLGMSATGRAVTTWRGALADLERVAVAPTSYVLVDAATGLPDPGDAVVTRLVPSHAAAAVP